MLALITSFFFKGKYFHSWMKCYISAKNIQHELKYHPSIQLTNNCKNYPFLRAELKKFCIQQKVTQFHLLNHHFVLRSKLKKDLPALSSEAKESGK
jgi:hypothetical protein